MKNKHLTVSATQCETFRLCNRKWWFQRVRRLPEGGSSPSMLLGTVLHGVCERYLLADDLGRDASGNPVDLYPAGWYEARNRFTGEVEGTIPFDQRDLIRRLVATAISEGVLERRKGRSVEHEISMPVIEGVRMTGFADVLYPDCVEDHKTSRSTRYLQSAKSLATNTQALIYARYCLQRTENDRITIRHNQFVMDPEKPLVRRTEAVVSREEVEAFWEAAIVPDAGKMLSIAAEARVWTDIPDPDPSGNPCAAYGGCPYRTICGRAETEEEYKKRVSDLTKHTVESTVLHTLTTSGDSKMDLKARLALRNTASAAPVPTTSQDNTQYLSPPPWIDPANPPAVNGGRGFNANGTVCRISDLKAKQAGLPTSDMFTIEPTGDGNMRWTGKEGTPAEGLTGVSPYADRPPMSIQTQTRLSVPETPTRLVPPRAAMNRVEPPAEEAAVPETPTRLIRPRAAVNRVEAPTVEAAVPETPTPLLRPRVESRIEEAAPVPPVCRPLVVEDEGPEETEKKAPYRSGDCSDFTLLINCVPCTGMGRAVSLVSVFDELAHEVAVAFGKGSYWEIGAFDRRDALSALAVKATSSFGKKTFWVTGIGSGASDMKTLVDAIYPRAAKVIQGVAG